MPASLARQLIEAHRASAGPGTARALRGQDLTLRVDHVVLGGDSATLTMLAFEALSLPRATPELVLVCAEGRSLPGGEDSDQQLHLSEAAARAGAVFSRAGNGLAHQVHVARFAAPGRLALGASPAVTACGALAMLAYVAGEVEIAAALAGTPVPVAAPEVIGLELLGQAPGWLGGHDLALALKQRLPKDLSPDDVIECWGDGLFGLPVAERLAVARAALALGVQQVLFPADAATRRYLIAQDREADWKALAGEPGADYDRAHAFDLGSLEPLALRHGDLNPVAIREHQGQTVHAVLIGPEAGCSDLARLAALLRGRRVAEPVKLIVALSQRAVHEWAARAGVLDDLRSAGAQVLDDPGDLRTVLEPGEGAVVVCGFDEWSGPDEAAGLGGARFAAGIEACAACATLGSLSDPRTLHAEAGVAVGDAVPPAVHELAAAASDAWLVRPPAPDAPLAPPRVARAPLTRGPAIDGPLRGVVLLKLGDHATTERILPWGPRVRPHHADLEALSAWAFAGLDDTFAAHAAAEGGGFLVAGLGCGEGPPRPQPAMVVARLGVRAILARSFGVHFRRQLVLHGVLPLGFVTATDYDGLEYGDELEIPDLPDGLELRKPLVVRNLTQGTQLALRHDLVAREIEIVRAGGLLSAIASSA